MQERLITKEQLEEALEAQVVHGGRLGTNLCELGFLKEADLARVLGKQLNLPFASGEMVPDPAALKVADKAFYDDADLVPMRMDATRITCVVMSPAAIPAVDALAFKAGRRVMQVVVPEFRLNQMLRKYAAAFRPIRPIDMNTLRPSKKQAEEAKKPVEAGDLINEDDFANIYAQAMGAEATEEVLVGEVLEEAPAAPLAPVAPPAVQVLPGRPPGALPMMQPAAVQPPAAPPPKPAAPPEPPEPPPLQFAEAQALLQRSANRDEIALTVLRFARSKFRRALILNVQGDLVTGWKGIGLRVKQRNVVRMGVTLREENTFKMVRDLRSHFVGPMKATPGTDVFLKLLGGKFPPASVVLLPLLVRGKPVHLLYLDQGPAQMTPPDVGELLILSQGVTRSYEALINQRKASQSA